MRIVGLFLAIVSALAMGGMVYLAFFFVRYIADWKKSGTPLPLVSQYLIQLTEIVQHYGFFLLPAALVAFLLGIGLALRPDRGHRSS